jgi:phosphohistidine phosphatase
MKTLYAMRHAKSSWKDASLADFDRPLARRGVKAARNIARVLTEVEPRPALALCSTAARAAQTYEVIAAHLGYSIAASFLDELYGASPAVLLDVVRGVPDALGSVLLIAHNPGMQEFLIELSQDDDADASRQVRDQFPTAALATLWVRGEWTDLGPNRTTLTSVVLPRSLEHRGTGARNQRRD